MSFFDNLKKGAIEAALKAFDGFALSVTETQLNSLAATLARSSDAPVSIMCQPSAIALGGEIKVAGVPLTYSTRLALEAFEISPTRKTLTLRRLDNVDLGGNSLASALYARVVKVLLCGLFGIDPAKFALKDVTGVSVGKDLITANLDEIGATEIILEAIKARLPAALIPLLESLTPSLGATGNSLMARIGIEDIVIEAGAITGKLRIHPASNDLPRVLKQSFRRERGSICPRKRGYVFPSERQLTTATSGHPSHRPNTANEPAMTNSAPEE